MKGVPIFFTEDQDKDIVRRKRAGFTFAEIAEDYPDRSENTIRRRHASIKAQARAVWSAAPRPLHPNSGQEMFNAAAIKASQRLLKRQLETQQYSAVAREAWLVRHGDFA